MHDTSHMKRSVYLVKTASVTYVTKHDEIKSIDLCRQHYIMDERLHHIYMYLRIIVPIWYQNIFYLMTSRAGLIQRHAIKSIKPLVVYRFSNVT